MRRGRGSVAARALASRLPPRRAARDRRRTRGPLPGAAGGRRGAAASIAVPVPAARGDAVARPPRRGSRARRRASPSATGARVGLRASHCRRSRRAVALVDAGRHLGARRRPRAHARRCPAAAPRGARRGPARRGLRGCPKKSDARELLISVVAIGRRERPVAALVSEQRDDSFAFDLGPGPVASRGTRRRRARARAGVVRIARRVAADQRERSARRLPRGLRRGDRRGRRFARPGAFVRGLDRAPPGAGRSPRTPPRRDEATGEPRVVRRGSRWRGGRRDGRTGGPRARLTPAAGHVSAFDAALLARRARHATLLVVARDDGEAVDGSGGTLLRVRVREDGVDPPLALPGDGLGRGAPTLVDRSRRRSARRGSAPTRSRACSRSTPRALRRPLPAPSPPRRRPRRWRSSAAAIACWWGRPGAVAAPPRRVVRLPSLNASVPPALSTTVRPVASAARFALQPRYVGRDA